MKSEICSKVLQEREEKQLEELSRSRSRMLGENRFSGRGYSILVSLSILVLNNRVLNLTNGEDEDQEDDDDAANDFPPRLAESEDTLCTGLYNRQEVWRFIWLNFKTVE